MISTILVPVDGSDNAGIAADWAGVIAARFNAQVTLLHVMAEWGSAAVPDALRPLVKIENIEVTEHDLRQMAADRIVDAAAARLRAHGVSASQSVIDVGDAAGLILEHAKKSKVDLIVMGRRGLGLLPGLLLGSVSSKVLHLAECACLTVK